MPYRFRIGIKYQYTVSAKKQNTSETKMRGKKTTWSTSDLRTL